MTDDYSTSPFRPSAEIYDVVYQQIDYAGTAATVEKVIRDRNPSAASLLDMSCGTGLHLEHWRGRFAAGEGADVDSAMLDVARRRLPGVPLHLADYTGFDLGRSYDAVTCMFSSIGYTRTSERLDAAIAAMARHLSPGGVLVVEPWLLPEMIRPPFLRVHTAEADDVVVLRTTRHRYEGDVEHGGTSDMEFAYVVTTHDGSEFFTERHVMGVFPPARYVEAGERAGLDTEFLEGLTELRRGLVVGAKR